MLTRRGFTMIELLVALVLLGLVSAAVYRVLVNNQRVYMAQTQRIDLSQNIRAATSILPAEFRELSSSEGDITNNPLSATRLDIRAMRWLGFICDKPVMGVALNGVFFTIRSGAPNQPLFFGRAINLATDSVLVYYDGNPNVMLDDFWALGKPTAVQAVNCPDGRPGVRLTFATGLGVTNAQNILGAIPVGAPVRGFERVSYQLYQPSGDTSYYIGLQPSGQSVPQPLIGPVLSNGLTLTYFDSTGAVTANRLKVARIDFTVRARSRTAVKKGGSGKLLIIADSVTSSVALRGNRRF